MTMVNYLHCLFWRFIKGTYKFWPDSVWLRFIYWHRLHRNLNLKNPRRFTEKLNWLKLHDRNPLYTILVDKYEVKQYIKEILGEQMVIPSYGVWNHFDDIDFDQLPEKFVMKCTHDSGRFCICKDKTAFDIQSAKSKLEKSMNNNFFWWTREWPYKNVPRKIIAEEYLEDNTYHELRDYKFFCFDGVCKALFIATDRQNRKEPYFSFFDKNFNYLDITQGHPQPPVLPEKPHNFDLMIELAERLSKGFPHLRVDFYEVNGRVYFGELTFFHHSGIVPFEPREWDNIFGEWLKLPKTKRR